MDIGFCNLSSPRLLSAVFIICNLLILLGIFHIKNLVPRLLLSMLLGVTISVGPTMIAVGDPGE